MHIALLILNLNTRWVLVFNLMLWSLYPRKEPQYPSDRRLGGPQSREEKNILPLVQFKPQTIQPIAKLPYQLCYPSSYHTLWTFRNL